jgi:hypothetical protein
MTHPGSVCRSLTSGIAWLVWPAIFLPDGRPLSGRRGKPAARPSRRKAGVRTDSRPKVAENSEQNHESPSRAGGNDRYRSFLVLRSVARQVA